MALEQIEMFPLPNPCIDICESGPRGYCLGCLRSREERYNWPQKPNHEKTRILKLLAQRQQRRQQFLARLAVEEQTELNFNEQLSLPGFNR